MELLLAAAVVGSALAFVAWPLLRPSSAPEESETADDRDQAASAHQRQAIYAEVLEMELDHQVGKLSDADYRELSEAALGRAARSLARADLAGDEGDERLEREIAAMRRSLRAGPAVPSSGDALR